MAASYNYNRYQKEALANEHKVTVATIIIAVIVVLSIILVIIIYFFWRKKQEKVKMLQVEKEKEIDSLRSEYASIYEDFQKNSQTLHTLQLLENSHKVIIKTLQSELKEANSESQNYRSKYATVLKEISESQAHFEESKKQLVIENQDMKEKLDIMEQQESIVNYLEKARGFSESSIVKRLYEMQTKPLSTMNEEAWNQLLVAFSTYYPELFNDLNRIPKITSQKLRVYLLVAMKINDSCIAKWLDVKASRVSNIKSELNLSFFGDKSTRTLYHNLKHKYKLMSYI